MTQLLNELQEQLRVLPLARDYRSTAERLTGITRAVADALHAHLAGEEKVLYPALADHVEGLAATLERMRHEHHDGERTGKAFQQCLEQMRQNGRNRQEVMQRGRQYISWLRNHFLLENGRLFPLVERGLDPGTQEAVLRAMEQLSQTSSARVAQAASHAGQA